MRLMKLFAIALAENDFIMSHGLGVNMNPYNRNQGEAN